MNRTARFRTIVPIVTPYTATGELDPDGLAAHASLLVEAGVDGFFVCGTNGEGPLLSDDEVVEATRAVASVAPPGCAVITQVGRPSTRTTCVLLERAVEAGATAVAVVTPYFYELSRSAALEHYATVIGVAGPTPVHAYVIPAYARNDLEPNVVAQLAANGLAGIKDSTKSLDRHRAYVAVREDVGAPHFETFVGDDGLTLEALRLESSGVVPALGNVAPELFTKLAAAAEARDDELAEQLQAEIVTTRAALRSGGIARLKAEVARLVAAAGTTYESAVRGPL